MVDIKEYIDFLLSHDSDEYNYLKDNKYAIHALKEQHATIHNGIFRISSKGVRFIRESIWD